MAQNEMRILILNSCRKWIGEAAHCFDLCRYLTRRGHRVVLGCRAGRPLEKAALDEGLSVLSLNYTGSFLPFSDWADVRATARVIRQEKMDLVHCHRGKDHWSAATANTLFRLGTPLLRTRHVVTPARNHLLNRWLYGRATQALISVSEKALDGMGNLRAAIPPERIHVIRSAVDSERFHPDKRSNKKHAELSEGPASALVGLVARLQNVKGQRIFVEAAARLAAEFPDARFVIAGRGTDAKYRKLRRWIEETGIADRFYLLGYVDDLPQIMATLDVGVVASLGSEGSSRVSLEYMASGAAVAATRVGGIPELLDNGELGLLVEPNDAAALADAIGELLRNRDRREDLARRARRAVVERRSHERWIESIEEVYQSALADETPRPV